MTDRQPAEVRAPRTDPGLRATSCVVCSVAERLCVLLRPAHRAGAGRRRGPAPSRRPARLAGRLPVRAVRTCGARSHRARHPDREGPCAGRGVRRGGGPLHRYRARPPAVDDRRHQRLEPDRLPHLLARSADVVTPVRRAARARCPGRAAWRGPARAFSGRPALRRDATSGPPSVRPPAGGPAVRGRRVVPRRRGGPGTGRVTPASAPGRPPRSAGRRSCGWRPSGPW